MIPIFIILFLANFVTDNILYNADAINSRAAKVQKEARGHMVQIKNVTYTLEDIQNAKHVMAIRDISPDDVDDNSHTKWSNDIPKDTLPILIQDDTANVNMQEAGYTPDETKSDVVYTSPKHPQNTLINYKKNKQYDKAMDDYRTHRKNSYYIKVGLMLLMFVCIFIFFFKSSNNDSSNNDVWVHFIRN
ncbi:hypothetical protein [Apilactobacillus timberlakei]|uniref:hypothetical protein n=1 Tax=Apilactobacillus timberlakei TaxID=2008380 RepID=UPI0011270D0C|nr:hypothetical protein [Apilactobacillus timberlakei]TPR22265.1 hypothetical protein DY083_04220 [Apilactobacillus timberlakei]